jgi:hypothetical protein
MITSIARPGLAEAIARLRAAGCHEEADFLRALGDETQESGGAAQAAQSFEIDQLDTLNAARAATRHEKRNAPFGLADPARIQPLERAEAVAEAELARRRTRRVAMVERWQVLRRQLDRLTDAVLSAEKIRAAKPPALAKNATPESARADLAALDAEAETVREAPRPRADVLADLAPEVDALCTAPQIDPRRAERPARLAEATTLGLMGSGIIGDAGRGVLFWALRDYLIEKLAETVPDLTGAISDKDRATRLAALAQRRLEIERAEEALIRQAAAQGRVIDRRPDASAQAILQIVIEGRAR